MTFTFTLSGTGCSATTSDVHIKATPSSNLSASKTDVCPNTEVSLDAHCSLGGSVVNWNPGGSTVIPNAPDVAYTYKASCSLDGCTGNESSVEVRTHRILVDLKDVGLGMQPKALTGSIKDNLAPTNVISAVASPRLWTLVATGCSASESAVFKLTGPINFSSIDNNPPYALFANVGTTYFGEDHPNYGSGSSTFPHGSYNLVVDLRSADGVGGPFPKNRVSVGGLLATRSLQFTIGTGGTRQGIEVLSLNSLAELNWASIFQNPVSDEIVVRLSGTVGEEVSLGLVNLQGQTVQTRQLKLSSPQQYEVLNVGGQNAGMYILKAIKGDKVKTIKVVKAE
ncbi:MAG: T9SS type A sorting domain-containing protein [Spirosomataceae bacterium]